MIKKLFERLFAGELGEDSAWAPEKIVKPRREERSVMLPPAPECPGHESIVGPMGISTYCDGSCRKRG
jgi:hypothetical protein